MRWLNGIIDTMDLGLSKPQEMVSDREAWRAAIHGVAKDSVKTEQLNNKILTTVPFLVFLVQLFLLQGFLYQDLLTPTLMYDFPNHSKSMYDFSFFPILDFMVHHFSNTLSHISNSLVFLSLHVNPG